MKFAVIDIGSNTAKADLYKYKNDRLELTKKTAVRDLIADHKDSGALDPEGIGILINIMKDFVSLCKKNRVTRIFPYATQSLRGINNANEVLDTIKAETGLDVQIITGEKEAELCFRSFVDMYGKKNGALSDMGGGSTEITVFSDGSANSSVSIPFGSRSLVHELGIDILPDEKQEKIIRDTVCERVSACGLSVAPGLLYACGGTSSGMFRLFCDHTGKDESTATSDELYEFYLYCKADTKKAGLTAKRLTAERYDTVYTGMLAHIFLCRALGCGGITRCKSTCRRGYAESLIDNGIIK